MRSSRTFLVAATALLLLSVHADGQEKDEEKAILKRAEAFVAAFNKADAKALAGFWTPDGIYRDQIGTELKGRPAIEKSFVAFFAANKGVTLRINVGVIRFVADNVALEEGTTEVIAPDGAPPSEVHYVLVHVKRDGEWLLDVVKDSVYTPPTNYKHLKGLEWAIGDWVDDVDKGNIGRLSFSWGPNQNFIQGTFATTFKNLHLGSGTQRIGYDAAAKSIRSWTFDDDGGFGEGTWVQDGDRWTVKTSATLRDGKKVAMTNVVRVLDADTISVQAISRTLDGAALPDSKEMKMKRVK